MRDFTFDDQGEVDFNYNLALKFSKFARESNKISAHTISVCGFVVTIGLLHVNGTPSSISSMNHDYEERVNNYLANAMPSHYQPVNQ